MRYGPCGQVVDISRRPYRTSCRFLRAYEGISEINWVEALEDAPTLPYWSVISSLDLDLPDLDYDGPGEVPNTPRRFSGQQAPAGLTGDHQCGTEQDFEEGGEYLPDAPPAPYDDLGYLDCCEVPPPPPPVTPIVLGHNCSQAGGGVVGVDYEALVPLPFSDQWWGRIVVPVGVPCRFTWLTDSPGIFLVRVFSGANCDGLFYVIAVADVDVCHTFTSPFSPQVWPVWQRLSGGTGAFTVRFRIDLGACP